MLEPGAQIDIWVVETALGSGGMGSVYRCHNRTASRIKAAVKVLETSMRHHPEAEARFVREAEILFQLDHPNIVKVRNIRTDMDPPYLEMEFVEGESLEARLRRGALPFDESVGLMEQMASAVAYLHRKGVRHRDIKPANLLVKRDGRVKLVDFGLAMEADVSRITQQGVTFGTVSYAPPEWIAPEALDPGKWDIYAIGVVFYEMLTGRVAFPVSGQGSARQQAMQVIVSKQGHKPLDPGDHFHDDVRQLVRDMTEADPARRIGDAEVIHRRVRALRKGLKHRAGATLMPPTELGDDDSPSIVADAPMLMATPDGGGGAEASVDGGGFGMSTVAGDPLTWAPTAVGPTARQHTPMPAPSLLDAATAPAPIRRAVTRETQESLQPLSSRPPGSLGRSMPKNPALRARFRPWNRPSRGLRFAAPLLVGGALFAVLGVAAVAAVAFVTLSTPSASQLRPVDVVVTGLPPSVPVGIRLGDLLPRSTDGAVFSFHAVPHGAHDVRWVIGSDCPTSACPGLECPTWCGTGTSRTTIEPGTTPQILTVALSPPEGRPVRVELPEVEGDWPITATLAGKPVAAGDEGLIAHDVAPGRHFLTLSVGACEVQASGCWPDGTCPAGCSAWKGEIVVPWGPGEHVHTVELPTPEKGRAVAATVARPSPKPRVVAPAGGGAVTNAELARWLAKNPDWHRERAIAAGRADANYLEGWDGASPPSGAEHQAATHVSWYAAAEFCRSRGGLADTGAEPTRWTEGPGQPWIEFRVHEGRPFWRANDGRTSDRFSLKATNATMGFRCAR